MSRSVLVLGLALLAAPAAATPSIVGLGCGLCSAAALADDGTALVGTMGGAGFVWTAAGGFVSLGAGVDPKDVSSGGSVVVGQRSLGGGSFEAIRWTPGTGAESFVGQDAAGVSADGSVIVGTQGNQAYRWTEATGAVGLGFLFEDPEDPFFVPMSQASGVSSDGSVVAGTSLAGYADATVFRWTSAGMVNIVPGGIFDPGNPVAISSDGSAVAASNRSELLTRWTAAGGLQPVVSPSGLPIISIDGLDGDGSLLFGFIFQIAVPPFENYNFVWDPVNGFRAPADLLTDDYGLDLDGWTITRIAGISEDGLTLVGRGIDPNGMADLWLVSLPEPNAALLALSAALALRLAKRRLRQ